MKMVTQFNAKDMTSFGNFLLEKVKEGKKQPQEDGSLEVTHADFENWKYSQLKGKSVRAKFYCHFIDMSDNEIANVTMNACVDGPENESWSKYTPGGNLNIMIAKDAEALKLFQEGMNYYMDFTVAPE